MAHTLPNLPITEHLEAIASGVRAHTLSVLRAPPGTGKTTVLPLYLAQQEWLRAQSILILQPRRLAAKGVATRMSELLSEPVGTTVGYQVRLERRRSSATRIEVITEGLLTRRMLAKPELPGIGLIIFDEFHERSIHSDIGLPLALEIASALRSDLRLLVMSATLDSLDALPHFADAWRYSFESKPFPVDVQYASRDSRKPIWEETARAVKAALQHHQGDLLAFLPGAFEIERCRELLVKDFPSCLITPLYGGLSYEQQQAALRPSPKAARKVVLATNIAETSLTIDGIRIVIDSGLQKVSRSSEAGISTLNTERITRDAAEQRTGRAGRTGPGVCIRMWSEQEHMGLRPTREPEVVRVDLTQVVLELAAWGVRDPAHFNWLTRPSLTALVDATTILRTLGALREDGSITNKGETLVRLGTHPRIGACCLTARAHNLDAYAARVIALLEERTLSPKPGRSADCTDLIEALASGGRGAAGTSRSSELQKLWLKRLAELPADRLPLSERVSPEAACGFLLAISFPERIAHRRPEARERYLLASGVGAALQHDDPLCSSEYIVIAEMQERSHDALIVRAVPLDATLFDTHLKCLVTTKDESHFDPILGVMVSHSYTMLGAISLTQDRTASVSPAARKAALVEHLRTVEGFSQLPFSTSALALQSRCMWVRRTYPDLSMPDLSSDVLRLSEPFWLVNRLPESGRLDDITASDLERALGEHIPPALGKELDNLAPHSITLPSGKVKSIDYSDGTGPVVEAIVQEVFGLERSPTIGRNRVPITFKLLSPARRPVQVTRDLTSFWKNGYPAVRKELRGRYPKHAWPEDPTKA